MADACVIRHMCLGATCCWLLPGFLPADSLWFRSGSGIYFSPVPFQCRSSAVPVPFQCRSGLPAPSNDAFRIKSKINIGTSRRRRKKRRKERKRERKKRPFVSLNPLGNFHPSILPSIHPSIRPSIRPICLFK